MNIPYDHQVSMRLDTCIGTFGVLGLCNQVKLHTLLRRGNNLGDNEVQLDITISCWNICEHLLDRIVSGGYWDGWR